MKLVPCIYFKEALWKIEPNGEVGMIPIFLVFSSERSVRRDVSSTMRARFKIVDAHDFDMVAEFVFIQMFAVNLV